MEHGGITPVGLPGAGGCWSTSASWASRWSSWAPARRSKRCCPAAPWPTCRAPRPFLWCGRDCGARARSPRSRPGLVGALGLHLSGGLELGCVHWAGPAAGVVQPYLRPGTRPTRWTGDDVGLIPFCMRALASSAAPPALRRVVPRDQRQARLGRPAGRRGWCSSARTRRGSRRPGRPLGSPPPTLVADRRLRAGTQGTYTCRRRRPGPRGARSRRGERRRAPRGGEPEHFLTARRGAAPGRPGRAHPLLPTSTDVAAARRRRRRARRRARGRGGFGDAAGADHDVSPGVDALFGPRLRLATALAIVTVTVSSSPMKPSMPLMYAGNPRDAADQVGALEKAGLDTSGRRRPTASTPPR